MCRTAEVLKCIIAMRGAFPLPLPAVDECVHNMSTASLRTFFVCTSRVLWYAVDKSHPVKGAPTGGRLIWKPVPLQWQRACRMRPQESRLHARLAHLNVTIDNIKRVLAARRTLQDEGWYENCDKAHETPGIGIPFFAVREAARKIARLKGKLYFLRAERDVLQERLAVWAEVLSPRVKRAA